MGKQQRAIVFVDGNNFYHGMRTIGLPSSELHYEKFSKKLVMGRQYKGKRKIIPLADLPIAPDDLRGDNPSVRLHVIGGQATYSHPSRALLRNSPR